MLILAVPLHSPPPTPNSHLACGESGGTRGEVLQMWVVLFTPGHFVSSPAGLQLASPSSFNLLGPLLQVLHPGPPEVPRLARPSLVRGD